MFYVFSATSQGITKGPPLKNEVREGYGVADFASETIPSSDFSFRGMAGETGTYNFGEVDFILDSEATDHINSEGRKIPFIV